MKKLFLFLTMFLFALTGVTRAEQVEIGAGTTTTTGYFPTYTYYNYCLSQQLFLADEIGTNGYLAAISFNVKSGNTTRHLKVYMKEVDYGEFASTSAWETFAEDEYYFDGDVTFAPGWVQIMLDNSFNYTGEGNLLVSVVDETGSWTSSAVAFYAWNKNEEYCRLCNYRDTAPYDVTNPGVTGSRSKWKNNIKLLFMGAPELEVNPLALDFGYRPIGAWMEGETITVNNLGAATSVTTFVPTNSFFTTNVTVPFTIGFNEPVELGVSTGTGAAGVQEGQLVIAHAGGAALVDLTATAYEPVEGDVYEIAKEVEEFPYQDITTTENLYKNYNLPGMNAEAVDAVYKVTFDEPVLFNAGTNGQKATTVLYTEDFYGEGGPMSTNNYDYNGPSVNPGPVATWFNYAATGAYTFYGSSEGGGMYFGYKIAAEYLQGLNLGSTSLLSVESAAYGDYPYHLIVVRGGNTPSNGDLIYAQSMVGTPGEFSYFTMDIDQPFVVGDEEAIWVLFYSESPYAAYCQINPIDTENGKIWYSMDGSSWNSNVTYTPQIYCYFRTLLGRDLVMDLSDMSIKEINGNGTMEEANAHVNGVSKAQLYAQAQQMKADRNRDAIIIEQGFEDGMGDWTMYNCSSYSGITTSNPNTGSYCFDFYYTANYPQYLISPELVDNNGGTMTFYAKEYSTSYPESYKLGYSTTTNDVSAFTFGAEVTDLTLLYAEKTFDFPAGTKYVCIACTSNNMFHMYVDDITIELQSAGPAPAQYQIENMYVPAGTYYVAVASTTENFQVDMFTEEAPAPVQAFLYDPIDGDTGIEEGYIMQWVLGDYTEEVQVLLGTTYPPTTPLIDWTDYLVESMFLENIQNNKTYFVQVNARNAVGTTYGEIIGFTTLIDPVEGFTCDDPNLYPGQSAHFTWDANRSIKGYNMYMDGVKLNETLITETEFTSVSDLAYNMDGYMFQVSAVYDEGESALSEPIAVRMTGFGSVNGHVWEQDSITPVALANVEMRGLDEYGVEQTFSFPTNPSGYYEGELLAGVYTPTLVKPGYQESTGAETTIVYDELTADADIVCYEIYYALQQIKATEMVDDNNVLVEWDWTPATMIVDFETGDLSQADFSSTSTYPWEVTTVNPYEGVYAIKSMCEGIANGSSSITATVDVPFDAKMGFYVKVSTEANYDKFYFYIDGAQQGGALSGNADYVYKEYAVTEGTHTYTWKYEKDSSVNSNDDCVYVDYITMYRQDEPMPGGQTYDFEDMTMQGWTTIDGGTPSGYGWQLASDKIGTGYGHNGSTDCVLSQSYDNNYGVVYPDNYLISPSKLAAQNGAYISFWACGQDASYAAEHFGVAVSTGGQTAAEFTTIQEWTMTSKRCVDAADEANYVRGTRDQGNWYEYTVDLSSYAGQQIWVAIRHFNCSDMFYLDVDDITLSDGSAKGNRGERMLDSYKLYRRNVNGFVNYDDAEAELIATLGTDVYSYTDNAWATLPYGMYQWGIQAKYEGNQHPLRSEVVIGEGTTTSAYLPAYYLYNYSLTEQIYTAAEIGTAGTISSIAFNASTAWDYDIDIYMVNTSKASFEGATDWVAVTAADKVYSGAVSFVGGDWTTITLDTPFNYNGSSNLLVVVDNNTGDWGSGGPGFLTFAAEGAQAIYAYNDYTNYDPASPSGNGTTLNSKNQIKLNISGGGQGGNNGLSEMIWSNVIEKDMYSTVTFDITLNNGQAPLGAVITMEGEEENYTATCDDPEGIVVIENVRKGEYEIVVALAGYTSWGVFDLIDEDEEVYDNILLTELILGVNDLYVSPTGWTMWNGLPNDDRAPVKYKVMLDGVVVDEVENMFYQIDVENMEEGEEHTTSVAALYATGLSDYADYTWQYNPCENYAGATEWGTEVSGDQVTVSFELPGGVTPGPQPGTGDTFSVNFDDSQIPAGWTMIDGGTPSGYGWQLASTKIGSTGYGHNSSTDCILSQSYDNNYGVVYPDNYFISPSVAITNGSTFSLWACGQDASYAAEHFGVAVSTTGTSASDFTMVNEWTIGSKSANGMRGMNDQSTWTQYSVDLSAYAGQNVYIAVRHFNCSDMFYLDVDDLALTVGTKGRTVLYEPHFVTDPGAMANGADASWIKNNQGTWGPNCNNGSGYKVADNFTLDAASTITEIEVYGYQTGSTTTSTFTGLYAVIYDGAPNANGQIVWGDETTNIMTSTAFTNCYRGSDGETTATTRPIMAITASNLNIELPAGTYYLAWGLTGSASSGPWAGVEAYPEIGNSGDGLQLTSTGWGPLTDGGSSTPYGVAFKLVGEGGGPGPGPQPTGDVLGAFVFVDGELLTMEPATTDVVIDDLEVGEHEICIRVVYSDYAMSCMDCMTVEIGEVSCDPVINLNGYYMNYQGQEGIVIDWEDPEGAVTIKLYEGTEYLGEVPAGTHPLFLSFEGQVPACTITIGAVAVYADCESEMVSVDIYYDDVEENEVVNAIYPNPTSDNLTIKANAMTRVSVYNAMGQMVYDQALNADETIINMGQFEAGVYMVSIQTENGTSVKRVTVVK